MEIVLPPEWEKRIADKVAGGEYPNAGEVVRESLWRLSAEEEAREKHLNALRAKIQDGIDSADRDEGKDGEEFFKELDEYIHQIP